MLLTHDMKCVSQRISSEVLRYRLSGRLSLTSGHLDRVGNAIVTDASDVGNWDLAVILGSHRIERMLRGL